MVAVTVQLVSQVIGEPAFKVTVGGLSLQLCTLSVKAVVLVLIAALVAAPPILAFPPLKMSIFQLLAPPVDIVSRAKAGVKLVAVNPETLSILCEVLLPELLPPTYQDGYTSSVGPGTSAPKPVETRCT